MQETAMRGDRASREINSVPFGWGAPWSKRPNVSGNARACTFLRVSARVVGAAGRCTIRPDADPIQPRFDVAAFPDSSTGLFGVALRHVVLPL